VGRLFPKKSRVIIQIHYSAHYAKRARFPGLRPGQFCQTTNEMRQLALYYIVK
jgi:hypothetical protein